MTDYKKHGKSVDTVSLQLIVTLACTLHEGWETGGLTKTL